MSGSSKLLIDEHPLQVLPSLAVTVGLNEAIILQQVHYWLRIAEQAKDKNKFIDGCWWTYGTVEDWREKNFPFWSESTVQRAFANLEKMGVLISKKFNAPAWDHTKWYTIDYVKLEKSVTPKCDDRLPHNDVIDDSNLTQPKDPNCGDLNLTETSSDTSSDTSPEINKNTTTSSALPPEPEGKIITEMEAETIYRNVTGFPSMPSMGRDEAIRIICDLSQCYGSGTTDYIRPYYLQYIKTRGRNGMVYKKTGFGFLDYAATGTMPTDYSAPPVAAPAQARPTPSGRPKTAQQAALDQLAEYGKTLEADNGN